MKWSGLRVHGSTIEIQRVADLRLRLLSMRLERFVSVTTSMKVGWM